MDDRQGPQLAQTATAVQFAAAIDALRTHPGETRESVEAVRQGILDLISEADEARPACYAWMDVRSPGDPAPRTAPCGEPVTRSSNITEIIYFCGTHRGGGGRPNG